MLVEIRVAFGASHTYHTDVRRAKKLYYVYRSTPKNPSWPSYNGSTLFDIRLIKTDQGEYAELSGNYYTDRKSVGRIAIKQIGADFNIDVSYY